MITDQKALKAVRMAAEHSEITTIETVDGRDDVVVLPASSPWVNGLRTALKEQKEGNDER